jgi:hypothetical protein
MQGLDLRILTTGAGHRDDANLSCKLVPDWDQILYHSLASLTDLGVLP